MNISISGLPSVNPLGLAEPRKARTERDSLPLDSADLGQQKQKTVLLQIDGLGYNALKKAMSQGLAPNIERYIKQNAAALQPFMCGIPAETIPVLMSLFHGVQVPANEWWSKEKMAVVDPTIIENEIAAQAEEKNGVPGLLTGGVAISAPITGGAAEARLAPGQLQAHAAEHGTWKTVAKEAWEDLKLITRGEESLATLLWRTGRDIVNTRRDLKESGQWNTWWDRHYPIMLALSKNIFPVVATEGVKKALEENKPIAYVDYADYDEAAHYYGSRSERAMEAVHHIDGFIGQILDKVQDGHQDYKVIVFSDHGQTDSSPFKKVFGQNLDEIIDSHIRQVRGDALVPEDEVVCSHAYSMNNIYFNYDKATQEGAEIEKRYPGMIEKLVSHPGIGLVVSRGPNTLLMRGPKGSVEVRDGKMEVVGKNPLEMYGDPAIISQQIQDYAAIPQTGDLLVFAVYDKVTDSTYDFGEKYTMKSLHGGLGGDQGLPFMLAPGTLGLDLKDTIKAIQLHEKVGHQHCRI